MSEGAVGGVLFGHQFEKFSGRVRSGDGSKREVPSLTGIRGIAALAVVVYHASLGASHGAPVSFRGAWAVDLFFALSGFVISMVYLSGPKVRWRHFFSARFARIYPLYASTSAVMAVILFGHMVIRGHDLSETFSVVNIIREVTLTTALPVIGGGTIWNDPSWSISVECWVYIFMFALLAAAQRAITAKASAVVVGILVIGLSVYLCEFTDPHDFTRGWSALARATVGFSAGWAAFRLAHEQSISSPPWLTDAVFFLITISIGASGVLTQSDAWFVIPLFPVLLIGLYSERGITNFLISSRPVHYLGEISFSMYLNHAIALFLIGIVIRRFGLDYSNTAFVTSAIAVTIPLSGLTHTYLEKPARRWVSAKLHRPTPPQQSGL